MTVVLGIDAAWTSAKPSGVALLDQRGTKPRLLIAAPSFRAFIGAACGKKVEWRTDPEDECSVGDVLEAATSLTGRAPSVIAVDMPLSRNPITGRREADNAISREFGAAWCSAHSPTRDRPGRLSCRYRETLLACGIRLATEAISTPALIEVYPHVALLRLCNADQRLPYKVGKTNRYWPRTTPETRKRFLLETWNTIYCRLAEEIEGLAEALPWSGIACAPTFTSLKPYEDALDAVVCAWAGLRFAQGRAKRFGDQDAAIWVPCAEAQPAGSRRSRRPLSSSVSR